MFFWPLVFIVIGVLALLKGADLLIDHASRLAAKLSVSTVVVGLTVISMGTILPELSVAVTSSLAHANDVIVGNMLGSSILKIGLILGIATLINPIAVHDSTLKHEFPWLMLSSVLVYFLAFDELISRGDGMILMLLGAAFMLYVIKHSHEDVTRKLGKQKSRMRRKAHMISPRAWIRVVLGILLVLCGAKLFVDASLHLANIYNISQLFIGIIIIAVGTSLPELITTTLSAARDKTSVGLGNILGSNIMNIFFVVGIAALIRPLAIHPDLLIFDFPMLIFFTLLVSVLFKSNHQLSRVEGGALIAGYIMYFIYSIKFWG